MPTKLLVKTYEYETGEGSVLGEGTFSKVRLCKDTATGKMVAVKIMSVEQLREEKAEAQVRREVSIARQLEHPNIVKMYDFIDDGKNLYVVLEYVSGGDVSRKLESVGKFSEAEARRIFQQLIVGLRYCHTSQRIAHRDLKPENMLLDAATGTIKISDFGLANVAKPTEANGGPAAELMQTVCGTATYSAPEVLKEMGYDGMVADIWSCGVILFQLLSGELPFDDENIPALYNKIERADYRAPRSISDAARDLIAKLLVPNPTQRYTLDQIVAHPWFAENFNRSDLSTGTVAPPPSEAAVASAVTKVQPVAAAEQIDDAFSIAFGLLSNTFGDIAGKAGEITQNQKRISLMVRGSSDEARKLISSSFVAIKAQCPDKGGLEMKGFKSCSKGLCTFNVSFVPTVSPSLTLTHIRLGRGDTADFEDMIRTAIAPVAANVSAIGVRPAA